MTPAELRAALSRLGLSQAEAARRMGMTPEAVAHWLSGRRAIPKYVEALVTAWLQLAGIEKPPGS